MNHSYSSKNILSKIWFALFIAVLMMLAASPLTTGAITLPSGSGSVTSPSFANTQQATLKIIDAAILKLNAAETVIEKNPTLTAATKTSLFNTLNGIESALLASKTEVQQATTSAELQAAYSEVISYLKANKDVIKSTFAVAITEMGSSAAAKAQVYKEQVLQLLKVLEVTCPAQATTIDALTGQITQLEAEIATLNSAVKTKNPTTIKAEITKLNTLMKSMAKNVKTIQASCNIPTV